MSRRPELLGKPARALDLREKGVPNSAIAERLGVSPNRVSHMLNEERARREKAGEVAE